MERIFSNRNTTEKVKGTFFVTYTAINKYTGRKYITVHLNPCGSNDKNREITADELNKEWNDRYKGKCPFNGDEGFEVIKLQQRTQF